MSVNKKCRRARPQGGIGLARERYVGVPLVKYLNSCYRWVLEPRSVATREGAEGDETDADQLSTVVQQEHALEVVTLGRIAQAEEVVCSWSGRHKQNTVLTVIINLFNNRNK